MQATPLGRVRAGCCLSPVGRQAGVPSGLNRPVGVAGVVNGFALRPGRLRLSFCLLDHRVGHRVTRSCSVAGPCAQSQASRLGGLPLRPAA